MKTYEVEIASTTYRTFEVKAESSEDAQDIAFDEMYEDCEISKAWKQNAEITHVEETENSK